MTRPLLSIPHSPFAIRPFHPFTSSPFHPFTLHPFTSHGIPHALHPTEPRRASRGRGHEPVSLLETRSPRRRRVRLHRSRSRSRLRRDSLRGALRPRGRGGHGRTRVRGRRRRGVGRTRFRRPDRGRHLVRLLRRCQCGNLARELERRRRSACCSISGRSAKSAAPMAASSPR